MTSTTKQRVLWIIAAASWLLLGAAAGQTTSFGSAKIAIGYVAKLPRTIGNTHMVISDTPIGPWELDVKCLAGALAKEVHYSYSLDFGGANSQLVEAIAQARNNSQSFTDALKPMTDWMKSLPQVSSDFSAAADRILAVKKEIGGGVGPTTEQQEAVTKALEQLTTNLNQGVEQLKKGTSAVARFLQETTDNNTQIKQVKDNLVSSAEEDLRKLEDFISDKPCGQDDAKLQFDGFKVDLQTSLNTFDWAFGTLTAKVKKADDAVAVLLGTLMSITSDYDAVLKQLQPSRSDELASVIQSLRLAIAKRQWDSLATYARLQFN